MKLSLSIYEFETGRRTCSQRTGLAAVWAFEIRQPVTEVDDCNIADVLFIAKFITSSCN